MARVAEINNANGIVARQKSLRRHLPTEAIAHAEIEIAKLDKRTR